MKKKYMGGGMMKRDMEGEMMDRMGRGMAKAEMQEKAMKKGGIAEAIKKHEKQVSESLKKRQIHIGDENIEIIDVL